MQIKGGETIAVSFCLYLLRFQVKVVRDIWSEEDEIELRLSYGSKYVLGLLM